MNIKKSRFSSLPIVEYSFEWIIRNEILNEKFKLILNEKFKLIFEWKIKIILDGKLKKNSEWILR